MKKLYIMFSGGGCYYETTKKTVETYQQFGVDRLLVYDDWWLENKRPEYVRQQQWLRGVPTGPSSYGDLPHACAFNYGAFKPLIILDALERFCAPGDIVAYVDADCYPRSSLQPLYDICAKDGGIMLFGTGVYRQKQYCKRECMAVMGQDEPRYADAEAGCSTYVLFQKPMMASSSRPMQLLWEWFSYCHNPLANPLRQTGRLSLPEYPDFKEHRFDQSILTNLAHKYGYRLYPMAENGGELYPAMFHQIYAKTMEPTAGQGRGSMFRNVND